MINDNKIINISELFLIEPVYISYMNYKEMLAWAEDRNIKYKLYWKDTGSYFPTGIIINNNEDKLIFMLRYGVNTSHDKQLMERFVITKTSAYQIRFEEHVIIDLLKPISLQLNRQRLYPRSSQESSCDDKLIKKIIDHNSSLRVEFGWSFESVSLYCEIMNECIDLVIPKFNIAAGNMCSDGRCDWIGFLPFNAIEQLAYNDLSTCDLILFNNELIDFQTAVIEFITNHPIFRQHAIIRDHKYRYETFKTIRNDPEELAELFSYYIQSAKNTSSTTSIPRDIIEDNIGCHYLRYPNVFFESLNFYKLRGEVSE